MPDGSYALSYRIAMSDGRFYFADAGDGRNPRVADAFRRQSAVGAGSDSRGRRKKLGTTRAGSRFQARDGLRPAEIVTLDGRFDFLRIERLVQDHFLNDLPPGGPVWHADDVAADTDNDWDDPAVVEAHAHTGWTYDYLHARHGWRGLDGGDGRIFSAKWVTPCISSTDPAAMAASTGTRRSARLLGPPPTSARQTHGSGVPTVGERARPGPSR